MLFIQFDSLSIVFIHLFYFIFLTTPLIYLFFPLPFLLSVYFVNLFSYLALILFPHIQATIHFFLRLTLANSFLQQLFFLLALVTSPFTFVLLTLSDFYPHLICLFMISNTRFAIKFILQTFSTIQALFLGITIFFLFFIFHFLVFELFFAFFMSYPQFPPSKCFFFF